MRHSELYGPGVALKCPALNGLHVLKDNLYLEIINLKTDQPVKKGEEGKLVLTSLCREAMPLIRFRIRDPFFCYF